MIPIFPLDKIVVRPYEQRDRERVLAIHDGAFRSVAGESYEKSFQRPFGRRLTTEGTLIAEMDGNVLGFVTQQRMDTINYLGLINLIHTLTCAEHKDPTRLNEEVAMRRRQDKTKEETYVHFGKISPSVLLIQPETLLGTDFAVALQYQDRGIGTLLATKALQRAREQKVPMVLAQAIAESSTVNICLDLGLEEIVTYGPYYANGENTTILGMNLK